MKDACQTALMRYRVLASDYDGTIAADGRVSETTLGALERVRSTGRALILVTGRQLTDLQQVFDRLDLFERAVVENGAAVYSPSSGGLRILGPPPSPDFIDALRRRDVSPLSVGHVIVATSRLHDAAVLETIRQLDMDLQIAYNIDAVMVLPRGVNKGTGLQAALEDLGLSPRACVAIGDAENDEPLLAVSGCGVAVGNAVPSLAMDADLVMRGACGDGVVELVERLLTR